MYIPSLVANQLRQLTATTCLVVAGRQLYRGVPGYTVLVTGALESALQRGKAAGAGVKPRFCAHTGEGHRRYQAGRKSRNNAPSCRGWSTRSHPLSCWIDLNLLSHLSETFQGTYLTVSAAKRVSQVSAGHALHR